MYRPEEPEVNFEQILERVKNVFKRFRLGGGGGIGATVIVVVIVVVVVVVRVRTASYTRRAREDARPSPQVTTCAA